MKLSVVFSIVASVLMMMLTDVSAKPYNPFVTTGSCTMYSPDSICYEGKCNC